MVKQDRFVACAVELKKQIQTKTIPYVPNGMTLDGMDCQGLCEFLLMQSGVPKAQCSYAGSNDMWRNALSWRGTPEDCLERFGEIPKGAWLFIHASDGGEPSHYADDQGNASHVGVYLGNDVALHASASRGCVAESVFRGKAINGGWNMVGLCKHVDYGVNGGTVCPPVGEVVISKTETTTRPTIAVPSFAKLWRPVYSQYTWRMGDTGKGTREVQTALQKIGYNLAPDGVFGRGTDWAVKHFQQAQGLASDGVVGAKTWAKLVDAVNASRKEENL